MEKFHTYPFSRTVKFKSDQQRLQLACFRLGEVNISQAAGELTDNDTDKEKLVSLSKELLKAKGEDVSRLCVEMGKLIPLGEGYEDYYPSAKNSGGSVGVDDQQ